MTYLSSKSALRALGAVLPFIFLGCGGSAKASAGAKAGSDGASAEGEVNFDEASAWDTTENTATEEDTAQAAGRAGADKEGTALLGARHDLFLSGDVAANCQCLAVLLGGPSTPGMVWAGKPPVITPHSQWVVALGSDGVSCDKGGPGASYMGYSVRGADVIVTVEAAVEGRPVTHGAIIPRPQKGGKVILRPSGDIPYGRGFAGEPECPVEPTP